MSFGAILAGILQGAQVTLGVAAYALVYAVPAALLLGIAQYMLRGPARWLATGFIEFWRSNAVIILLYLFYYVLPFAGLRWSAMNVAALVLGLNIGAYASQAVRAALEAVPRGQVEAGRALSLSRLQVLRLVEMPQGFRAMVPSFVNESIRLVQSTALVSLLTLTDMTFRAKEIGQITHQPAEIYTALLLAYFLLCWPIALAGRRAERWAAGGRGGGA